MYQDFLILQLEVLGTISEANHCQQIQLHLYVLTDVAVEANLQSQGQWVSIQENSFYRDRQ